MRIKMPKGKTAPSADEFVTGATASPTDPLRSASHQELPWLDPRVRDDLRVQVNAKLPEKLMVQRDWLAARLKLKKQDVLEIALSKWVEEELVKLGLKKES